MAFVKTLWTRNLPGWLFALSIAVYGLSLQFQSWINRDAANALERAKRMVAGETLYVDILDVNHPMITYIRMLAVYLAMPFEGLAIPTAMTLIDSFIVVLAFFLTWHIVRKTEVYQSACFRVLFVTVLSFVLFLLPLCFLVTEFGQKEHLFIALCLPYICTHLWSEQQRKDNPFLMGLVGVMAGIGCCIKIYFVMIPLVLEITRMVDKRSLWSWWRWDSVLLGGCLVSFLAFVLLFHMPYVTETMPLADVTYFLKNESFTKVFVVIPNAVIFFLIPVALIYPLQQRSHYASIMMLMLWATLVIFIVQKAPFHYKFLPVTTIGLLLSAKICADVIDYLAVFLHGNKLSSRSIYFASLLLLYVMLLFQPVRHISLTRFPTLMQHQVRLQGTFESFEKLAKKYQHDGGGMFFSLSTSPYFPFYSYSDAKWLGPYNCTHFMYGLNHTRAEQQLSPKPGMQAKIKKAEQYLQQKMTKALRTQRPAFVAFYIGQRYKHPTSDKKYTKVTEDTLNFFLQDQDFKQLWTGYHFKGTFKFGGGLYAHYLRNDLQEPPKAETE